ncbi:MAG TPA: hypothetical protein VEY92_07510 [Pseudoxanthomonas sp.]|nr:hypothetical protein [Pseudoxanthomonas sp.]
MNSATNYVRLSGVILIVAASQSVACSSQPGLTQAAADQSPATRPEQKDRTTDAAAPTSRTQGFEGQWSYRDECDRGHFVTLDIQNENGAVTGSWSDGTLVRGSQGRLRGRIENDRLVLERCDDSGEAGGLASCPDYGKSQEYLVAKGDALVWYQGYGSKPVEYVVLGKGAKPPQPPKACDEDQQGAEQ